MFYCLTALVLTAKSCTISSTEKVASTSLTIYGTAAFTLCWKILYSHLFCQLLGCSWTDTYLTFKFGFIWATSPTMQATAPCQSKKENKTYTTQASAISYTVLWVLNLEFIWGFLLFEVFLVHIHKLHSNSQVINTWLFTMVRKLPYSEDFLAIGRQESAS